jgi:hypothetical protein
MAQKQEREREEKKVLLCNINFSPLLSPPSSAASAAFHKYNDDALVYTERNFLVV